MKKNTMFSLSVALMALVMAGCPVEPESEPNTQYTKEYCGEWLRMDTGDTWYISSGDIKVNDRTSPGAVSLNKQSDRVIEVTDGGQKYYLFASRPATASFTGKIAGFPGENRTARAAAGGLGGIKVIISNLKDAADRQTATTDANGNFTADNVVAGDEYEVTPEGGSPAPVTPSVDGDHAGTITVTSGANFKAGIQPASITVLMNELYAETFYDFYIDIKNYGTTASGAVQCAVGTADGLTVSPSGATSFTAIAQGETKRIPVSIRCNDSITAEYVLKTLPVTVTAGDKTFTDSVSLRFYRNEPPTAFNIRAASDRVYGIVMTKAGLTKRFSVDAASLTASVSMPRSAEDYIVMVSAVGAQTAYSLGINAEASGALSADAYEPNNAEASATSLTDAVISATASQNDMDYYRVNLGNLSNVSGSTMVQINGGTFMMGSPLGDGGLAAERPQHQVTVSSFYMSNYEVTQKEWREVMGTNPSLSTGDTLPVEQVSWFDALEYCNERSRREGLAPAYTISESEGSRTVTWNRIASGYRLPTEAEWEYAARGGNASQGYAFPGSNNVNEVGWYADNSGNTPHAVGTKAPNELGLYDMGGNVWEWCWDWEGNYSSAAQTDPTGPSVPDTGFSDRIIRGGTWSSGGSYMRSACRAGGSPPYGNIYTGFRLVRP